MKLSILMWKIIIIVNNISLPNFIILRFDLSSIEDSYDKNGNPKSINLFNNIIWNKINQKIDNIINVITEDFIIYNVKYNLKGFICSPFPGHYSGLLFNLKEEIYLLEKGFTYYYDDLNNNNEILKLL